MSKSSAETFVKLQELINQKDVDGIYLKSTAYGVEVTVYDDNGDNHTHYQAKDLIEAIQKIPLLK